MNRRDLLSGVVHHVHRKDVTLPALTIKRGPFTHANDYAPRHFVVPPDGITRQQLRKNKRAQEKRAAIAKGLPDAD